MMKSISLTEMVYQSLRQFIIQGKWPAGTKLVESKLSKTLHVSRTPIRAALQKIHEEGLLDYTPYRGYTVNMINADDVREIYKLRNALEQLAAVEAMQHMSPEDTAELKEIVARSEQALRQEDMEKVVELTTEFNRRVSDLAAMPRLKRLQQELSDYLVRLRTMTFDADVSDRSAEAVHEHREIIEAMESGNEKALRAVIKEHLERSQEYILQHLDILKKSAGDEDEQA